MKLQISDLRKHAYTEKRKIKQSELEKISGVTLNSNIDLELKNKILDRFILLDIQFKCQIKADCDRCLDGIDYEISDRFTILLTESDYQLDEDNADIIHYYQKDDTEIDIGNYLKDSLILAVPITIMPRLKTNGFCSYCHKDFSTLIEESKKETANPEFAKLKSLFKKQ